MIIQGIGWFSLFWAVVSFFLAANQGWNNRIDDAKLSEICCIGWLIVAVICFK